MVKNPLARERDGGDMGGIPGWGRFPGEGHGNLFSILAWRTDRGAWWATAHRVAKNWT